MFDKEGFLQFVLDSDVVGLFEEPVTLKSGRNTNFYVKWRSVVIDVFGVDVLSDFVLDFARTLRAQGKLRADPHCFLGVPEGATKLGVVTQYKHAMRAPFYGPQSHPMAMGRAKPKPHGLPDDRFFVGAPKGPTILIEDTTTTGGSLIDFLDSLLESGTDVIACFGLTNRMEKRDDGLSVAEAVAQRKTVRRGAVPYYYLSSAPELLPEVIRRKQPAATLVTAIEEEFAAFGVMPLTLR